MHKPQAFSQLYACKVGRLNLEIDFGLVPEHFICECAEGLCGVALSQGVFQEPIAELRKGLLFASTDDARAAE